MTGTTLHPASYQTMNQSEKTETKPEPEPKNGVPDEAKQGESKGSPNSDREQTETAAR